MLDQGIPTSVDFVRNEPNQFVVSTTTSMCSIIDTETGAEVVALNSNRTYGKYILLNFAHMARDILLR